MTLFVDLLIVGIAVGALYGLLALSVSLIYASLDIIHFAQGELFTMGAFFGWVLYLKGVPFILAILLASVGTAVFAILIQKTIYNPILSSSGGFSVRGLTFVVAGFGMSAILQNSYWLVWGAVSKTYEMNFGESIKVGSMSIQPVYLIIMVVALIVMTLLTLLFKKTKIGLAMKAVSYNKTISSLMGVNVSVVVSFSFGLAAFLSAISGVMSAQIIFVRYNMAAVMLLKAFSAAVVGGLGNVYGAMLGGIIIGIVETFGGNIIGAQYKDIISFAIMIIVLMVKPAGLFATRTKQKA
jgi:branched-chain amino acid transport system permease protein